MQPDDRSDRVKRVQRLLDMIDEERADLLAELSRAGKARKLLQVRLEPRLRENARLRHNTERLLEKVKRGNRRPPAAGLGVPAVPPQGPLPRSGGAEAPLDFD